MPRVFYCSVPMFTISVKSNIEAALKKFQAQKAQIALATAKALTFTAERVRDAERTEIRRVFDRPSPFTLNSLYLRGATPRRLEARVWFKDLRNRQHYLVPQVHGGERELKRFERHLRSSGILRSDQFVVPGSRAALDAYGNINRGQLVQALSALRALPEAGYLANRSARSAARRRKSKRGLTQYFAGSPHPGMPEGIWQRAGLTGIRPIFIFVSNVQYRRRFDFYGIAKRVAEQHFDQLLDRELQRINAAPLPLAA